MAINNLKINKIKFEYLLKNIKPVEQTEDKQEITVDIDELTIDEKYKPYLKHFIKKTNANFNFRNSNEILRTLKINKLKKSKSKKYGATGYYNFYNNKIKIYIIDTIYHELFHAFTYHETAKNYFCGFNQGNDYLDIANSLNEGYTDLLTKRYFDIEIAYMMEANIASKIELMLGKEKMRSMYTANDLRGLIEFLSKHSSKQEAIGFITQMDKLDNYDYESKKAINLMNILSNYLVDVYLNFLAENYSLGIIDNADVNNELTKFKDKFVKHAFDDKKLKKEYLRSSDYLDITSKLSNGNFQKQLRKKVLTK